MFYFVVFIIALFLASSARPKPQQPPAAQSIDAPTAEEGRAIPKLFGTRDITQSNVVWYGDTKAVAIKKKGGKK